MKTAIYVRVSTEGQTYNQQVDACKNYCRIKGWNDIDIYSEKESSKKARPIFEECLRRARNGDYKNIIVFRLDRAWRSSRQFIMDFDNLQSKGINVISVMEGLDPTTPIGKAMMTILVALGELEREQISLATKQRLNSIKEMNKRLIEEGKEPTKKLGRKKGSKDKNKRSSFGYQMRWYKQRGGKINNDITPISETLEINNK